jgi:hypothetical protein
VKYSFKKRDSGWNGGLCQFKAPWEIYDKTEFSKDGLFHVARNHRFIAVSTDKIKPYRLASGTIQTSVFFPPTLLVSPWSSTNYSTMETRRFDPTLCGRDGDGRMATGENAAGISQLTSQVIRDDECPISQGCKANKRCIFC